MFAAYVRFAIPPALIGFIPAAPAEMDTFFFSTAIRTA
jgi:hypothetical protein